MEKNKKKQIPEEYFPLSPIYDPINKEDALPLCDPEIKQALDPNYYALNYVPKQEDGPTLVENLVVSLDRTTKEEEDQGEDKREKINEGDTKKEEDRKEDKTQADLGQEKTKMMIIWTIQIQTLSIRKVTSKRTLKQNSLIIHNSV